MLLRALVITILAAGIGAAESSVESPPGLARAIERGTEALIAMQAADGSFAGNAQTALAGMALIAGGSTPTRGRHAAALARALDALLAVQDRSSGFLGDGPRPMYAHGFATLFLAECYGESGPRPVRRAIDAACDLILRAQNPEGGWRYQPVPTDADLSVTICQVMALRAAWNAGVGSPSTPEAIRRAIGYVRSCHHGDGTFSYQRGSGDALRGSDGLPRAGAGAMSLIGAGVTDPRDATLGPALAFIRRTYPAHLRAQGDYFWYGQYYCAQAMFHSPDPTDWDEYWGQAAPAIMRMQGSDGRWTQGENTAAYATAMALIILQVPNQYLPIFQR